MDIVIRGSYDERAGLDRRFYDIDLSRLFEDVCFEVWGDRVWEDEVIQPSGSIVALTSGLKAMRRPNEQLSVTRTGFVFASYGAPSHDPLATTRDQQIAAIIGRFLNEDINITYADPVSATPPP